MTVGFAEPEASAPSLREATRSPNRACVFSTYAHRRVAHPLRPPQRVGHSRARASLPGARLAIQRAENPLLQDSSKVRLYIAKHQTHARGLDVEN